MNYLGKTCAATAFALSLLAAPAMASTLTLDDAIEYREGNDPFGGNNGFIRVGDYYSPGLAKCDEGTEDDQNDTPRECDDWEGGVADGDYTEAFDLEYTSDLTFTWSFTAEDVTGIDSDDVLFPKFVAVKSGSPNDPNSNNGYYLFDVTGHLSGSISVASTDSTDSFFNSISHVSFYDTGDDTPPIPLPAAGWMLLAGVGGLAAMRRRRKS